MEVDPKHSSRVRHARLRGGGDGSLWPPANAATVPSRPSGDFFSGLKVGRSDLSGATTLWARAPPQLL